MSTTDSPVKTGIPMTKTNRLAILRRAREIISKPQNWAKNDLRQKNSLADDGYSFCVLGAIEQAVYDLGLRTKDINAFMGTEESPEVNGYKLGMEISLYDYSLGIYGKKPYGVNDSDGYEATLKMLDGYIDKVQLTDEAS